MPAENSPITSTFTTTPGSGFIKTDTVQYSLIGDNYNKNRTRVSEVFSGTSDPITIAINGGASASVL